MMYTIREASVYDIETIRRLADEIWWPTYSPILQYEQIAFMLGEIYSHDILMMQIAANLQTFLLLEEDGFPVAFASYSPREENPDIYKLHKIYCLPSTRGKGYGKVLLNEVIAKVLEAGKSVLELNVNRYNNAKSFYEKMGFSVIYEEDVPIGPYWMNDYVMRREL